MTVGFREIFRRNNQEPDNVVFVRLPVPSAQCFIGTEKYTDAGKFSNYPDDKLSQFFEETVSCFKHLGKDNNECRDITEK